MSALNEVYNYISKGVYQNAPGVYRATNRSEINNRLLLWNGEFKKAGARVSTAAILTAVLGELGNNSFDHNLGQWVGLPGCLVGIDFLSDRIRIALADSGQGIANSLRRVKPHTNDEADLLKAAFEEVISGRSPERRGNGLKFVIKNFLTQGGIGLVCLSGRASYLRGSSSELLGAIPNASDYTGTFTAIDWRYL